MVDLLEYGVGSELYFVDFNTKLGESYEIPLEFVIEKVKINKIEKRSNVYEWHSGPSVFWIACNLQIIKTGKDFWIQTSVESMKCQNLYSSKEDAIEKVKTILTNSEKIFRESLQRKIEYTKTEIQDAEKSIKRSERKIKNLPKEYEKLQAELLEKIRCCD